MFMDSRLISNRQAIQDILNSGMERSRLMRELGIKKAHFSAVENGQTFLSDSRLGKLAQLHGNVTERDLYIAKYREWLMREKGIDPDELCRA